MWDERLRIYGTSGVSNNFSYFTHFWHIFFLKISTHYFYLKISHMSLFYFLCSIHKLLYCLNFLLTSSQSPISERFVFFDIIEIINILICVFCFHNFLLISHVFLIFFSLSFSPLATKIYYQSNTFYMDNFHIQTIGTCKS